MNTALTIALLQEARRRIATNRDGFICIALEGISRDHSIDHLLNLTRIPNLDTYDTNTVWTTCDRLTKYIANNLAPCDYLGQWLERHLDRRLPLETKQLARLAWIDRMIHELETKGCLP